jgi:hypothetical protein
VKQEIPILWLRGLPVILDLHLALLYGVKTKRLNEQVRRNSDRFPEDFVFRLSKKEWGEVVANCDQLGKILHSSILPTAFTEQGALMASTVLRSATAIQMSIYIVRAFVRMREAMSANEVIQRRLAEIGPRTPAPGPCNLRLRLFAKFAYAMALIRRCSFMMRG